MITLTQCCCGCRLQTGALILGWLGVVGSFLGIIILSVTLVNLEDLIDAAMKNPDADSDQIHFIHHLAIIIISVFLAFFVINFVASACLIFGTTQNRHLFLLPWLLLAGIGIGFGCLSVVGLFLSAIGGGAPFGAIVMNFIILGVNIAIQVYFFLVVYSLYKQIRSENDALKNVIPLRPAEPSVPPTYPSYSKI